MPAEGCGLSCCLCSCLPGGLQLLAKRKRCRELVLVLIGLDGAGKSSLLTNMRGQPAADIMVPTLGFVSKAWNAGDDVVAHVFDLGGGKKIRGIWSQYFAEAYGMIYVIDSSDRDRLEEARKEFKMATGHAHLVGKPALIVANKQDMACALSVEQIKCAFSPLSANQIVIGCHCTVVPRRFLLEQVPWNPLDCLGSGGDSSYNSVVKQAGEIPHQNLTEGLRLLLAEIYAVYEELYSRVQIQAGIQRQLGEYEKAARKLRLEEYKAEQEMQESTSDEVLSDFNKVIEISKSPREALLTDMPETANCDGEAVISKVNDLLTQFKESNACAGPGLDEEDKMVLPGQTQF